MAEFDLVTLWRVAAPLPQAYDAILCCADWPKWWDSVKKAEEIEAGDADGVGARRRLTWKGRLPYRLTFDIRVTRAIPLQLLEGVASGELEGIGRWQFSREAGLTVLRCEWRVRTTVRWMNRLAPIAGPLFIWNHKQVMRQGAQGLARYLDTGPSS